MTRSRPYGVGTPRSHLFTVALLVALSALAAVFSASAAARTTGSSMKTAQAKPTIVLVHGA